MFKIIKKVFGIQPAVDYRELVKNGALIMDVRTKEEFNYGHIRGSQNFPLDRLIRDCTKVKKSKAIITCCASGMRSASAKRILKSKGYGQVYNGGGWIRLQQKIN